MWWISEAHPPIIAWMRFGLVFVSLTTSAMVTIDRSRMTSATGLYVVVRQIFGSIGIALVATFLARGQTLGRVTLAKTLNLPTWLAERVVAMQAFNHVFLLLALLFVLCFPVTFLLKSGQKR